MLFLTIIQVLFQLLMPSELQPELEVLREYIRYDTFHYDADTHELTLMKDGEIVYQDGTYLHERYYEFLDCAEWENSVVTQCYPEFLRDSDRDIDAWIEFTHHAMLIATMDREIQSVELRRDGTIQRNYD